MLFNESHLRFPVIKHQKPFLIHAFWFYGIFNTSMNI